MHELTEDQVEYLIISRLRDNIRFVFVTNDERGLVNIGYSHMRKSVNYLELLMQRYSQILKFSQLIQLNALFNQQDMVALY